MTTRRELNIRKRKQRILDAATRLISSEGIEACTMRRLAQSARLDVTTLYNYYGSKEQILEALRRSGARKITRHIEELEETEPLARIRAIVQVTLGYRESPTNLARHMNLSMPRRRPGEGPAAAAAKEALIPAIEAAIAAGLLSTLLDPEPMAMTVLASFHPWLELWASGVVDGVETEARVDYSLSLCLLAGATSASRKRLETDLRRSQRRLHDLLRSTRRVAAG